MSCPFFARGKSCSEPIRLLFVTVFHRLFWGSTPVFSIANADLRATCTHKPVFRFWPNTVTVLFQILYQICTFLYWQHAKYLILFTPCTACTGRARRAGDWGYEVKLISYKPIWLSGWCKWHWSFPTGRDSYRISFSRPLPSIGEGGQAERKLRNVRISFWLSRFTQFP